MPRYRRRIAPGSLQHLISRFVNRQFLLDLPGARARYLSCAARAFGRCDWTALSYALMSSHVHWAARAGNGSSDRLVRSLHVGFSGWLNRSAGRLGPVFADRHRNVECEGETAAALLAYIHNNPVRAGVVHDPADSCWTSHRAYVGLEPAPPWLDVKLGLSLCGFDATASGRARFHDFVVARAAEPRRPQLVAADLQTQLRAARRVAAAPVELASPRVTDAHDALDAFAVHFPIIVPDLCPRRPRWTGSALQVLHAIARVTGVSEAQLRGRSRIRTVSAARRLALLVWSHILSRPAIEMARALGVTNSAASEYQRRCSDAELEQVASLAASLHPAWADGALVPEQETEIL